MNVVKRHRFNEAVTAFELGYGILGRPLMNVLCYVVGDCLIDAGQTRMAVAMRTLIKDHPVNRILLTHHHEDHSGNAAMLAKACGAAVLGHPQTAYKMKHIRAILPYRHLIWGQSRPVDVLPLPAEVATERYRFVPIHTPGHSKDHTVYLEAQHGWLFSGDLYLGERIKFFRSNERIEEQIQSLQAVLQYDFEVLFCAHNPVLKDGRRRLQRKMAYLEEICGKVGELLSKGLPEKEIIRRMDPHRDRLVKFVTMGTASCANMIRSAIRAAR